jgi:hypothetical protein
MAVLFYFAKLRVFFVNLCVIVFNNHTTELHNVNPKAHKVINNYY